MPDKFVFKIIELKNARFDSENFGMDLIRNLNFHLKDLINIFISLIPNQKSLHIYIQYIDTWNTSKDIFTYST